MRDTSEDGYGDWFGAWLCLRSRRALWFDSIVAVTCVPFPLNLNGDAFVSTSGLAAVAARPFFWTSCTFFGPLFGPLGPLFGPLLVWGARADSVVVAETSASLGPVPCVRCVNL